MFLLLLACEKGGASKRDTSLCCGGSSSTFPRVQNIPAQIPKTPLVFANSDQANSIDEQFEDQMDFNKNIPPHSKSHTQAS